MPNYTWVTLLNKFLFVKAVNIACYNLAAALCLDRAWLFKYKILVVTQEGMYVYALTLMCKYQAMHTCLCYNYYLWLNNAILGFGLDFFTVYHYCIPQCTQCILNELTSLLLCVPFIFSDSEKCWFGGGTWWLTNNYINFN